MEIIIFARIKKCLERLLIFLNDFLHLMLELDEKLQGSVGTIFT